MSTIVPEHSQVARWLSRVSGMARVPAVIAARMPHQFSLKTFMWGLFCIALVIGASIIAAQHAISKKAARDNAIAAIVAEPGVLMFARNKQYIAGPNDSDPYTLWRCRSASVARIMQHATSIRSLAVLHLPDVPDPVRLTTVPTNPWVRELDLDGCDGLTPNKCRLLAQKFPNLHRISVQDTDIQRDGLIALSQLRRLRYIDVSRLSITPTEVVDACVLFPSLEHLVIEDADLTGHLYRFRSLRHLKTVDVSFGTFSQSDLARFLDGTACEKVIAIAVELTGQGSEPFVHDRSEIIDWGLSTPRPRP